MTAQTWEQQRIKIQADIDTFFGTKIDITPRSMSAFQCGETEFGLPSSTPAVLECAVSGRLLESSPACSGLLMRSGVAIEKLQLPGTGPNPTEFHSNILPVIFGPPGRLTPTGLNVQQRKELTDLDILISNLEASLFTGRFTYLASEIVRDFATAHRRFDTAGDIFGSILGFFTHSNEDTLFLAEVLNGVADARIIDPSHSRFQFLLYEDDTNHIRLRPFGAANLTRLQEFQSVSSSCPILVRDGILQPIQSILPELPLAALQEFEDLLGDPRTSESAFQRLFEEYPAFLLGIDFKCAHPQPVLYKDDGSKLIPDFFLEKMTSGWDAIVDLKRPYDDLLVRRQNRTYFRQHVQNAVAQLRYYQEWFESRTNRRQFDEAYGVRTFRPKMVIVIGRATHFRDDVERLRVLNSLPDSMGLWTYDEVLERAKAYRSMISRSSPPSRVC